MFVVPCKHSNRIHSIEMQNRKYTTIPGGLLDALDRQKVRETNEETKSRGTNAQRKRRRRQREHELLADFSHHKENHLVSRHPAVSKRVARKGQHERYEQIIAMFIES